MKNLFLILILLISYCSFSQVFTGSKANEIINGAEVVKLKDFSSIPDFVRFREGKQVQEVYFEKWISHFFPNGNFELKAFQKENTAKNEQLTRYRLYYKGVPVEFATYITRSENEKINSINGTLPDNISISINPSISEFSALEKAKEYIGAEVYKWELSSAELHLKQETNNTNATYFPTGELVIFPTETNFKKNNYKLAWKFKIYSHKPIKHSFVYVDANSGEILFENKLIHNADVVGSAETVYSGTRAITADSYGGYYRLRETGRGNGIETYDMNMQTDYGSAVDFTDTDNNWNNINAELDEYATDAHWAAEMTYDYYYLVHGRNSINGAGLALKSYVHFNLMDLGYPSNVNAFWDGYRMSYGDGSSSYTPLTTIDISAHEITHGLTSYTANLIYSNESGALNEAFSDIFGTTVEFYGREGAGNWLIGEDIGSAFRSLQNPNAYGLPDTYLGANWVTGTGDNGGVHTNCGALMYWYYLICEGGSGTNDNSDSYSVTGIGMEKAGAITFRLLTVYLTESSQYADARFYAIQSAIDLYGECSPEVASVTDAMHAIGLGGAYVPYVLSEFEAGIVSACAPPLTVNFSNLSINGSSFSWNFGDGATSTTISPSHTYTNYGTYTVELYANGGSCGEDTEMKTAYIVIDEDLDCIVVMPNSGIAPTQTACNGLIYDNGGPGGSYLDNTDINLTISPPGASSISLTFNSFDIEAGSGSTCDYDYVQIFDGSSTSSPLLGTFCNTTGSPGTINSTGGSITIRHYSDGAVNGSGYEISWQCTMPEAPPAAAFSANVTETCTGIVQFTDQSTNAPNSWSWEFGDGGTSTSQNPSYTYTENGVYSVSLTAGNEFGENSATSTNYIVVNMPDAPTVNGDSICAEETATISATGTGLINWYYEINDATPFFTGNTYTTSVINDPGTYTYYAENYVSSDPEFVGETNNTTGGGFFGNASYIHYLVFDCYESCILESVEVNADGAGNRSFALRNSAGGILQQKDVYIPNGISRVELDFELSEATNLQLVGLGAPNLFRNNTESTLSYPYNLAGKISIKNSSASTGPTDYYYYFYDWKITEQVCISPRQPVNVIVDDCLNIYESLNQLPDIYPNPAKNSLTISCPDNCSSLKFDIFEITGQLVFSNKIDATSKIDISMLKAGIYNCKITGDNLVKVVKLVVE
ncbi:MAG: M4 family metallopeptidase [Bacteroidales bacterium]|nr:M4 family metallopeptidase [Bacteroidales bacterium]